MEDNIKRTIYVSYIDLQVLQLCFLHGCMLAHALEICASTLGVSGSTYSTSA